MMETAKNSQALEAIVKRRTLNFNTGILPQVLRNRIYFGPFGNNKTICMTNEIESILIDCEGGNVEMVTFYSGYSYADFVGICKPVPFVRDDGRKDFIYEYIPGPFMRVLANALKSAMLDEKAKPYFLFIEEINRVDVRAVFGEAIQLLARYNDNTSRYPIHLSKEAQRYLARELGGDEEEYQEIRLPDNMFIWATINSMTEGVFPMDRAFIHHWDFEYFRYDRRSRSERKRFRVGTYIVTWYELRWKINKELSNLGIDENNFIENSFIPERILNNIVEDETLGYADDMQEGVQDFVKFFQDKVLMYLFYYAAKQYRAQLFSGCSNSESYEEVIKGFSGDGVGIFSKSFRKFFPRPSWLTVKDDEDEE